MCCFQPLSSTAHIRQQLLHDDSLYLGGFVRKCLPHHLKMTAFNYPYLMTWCTWESQQVSPSFCLSQYKRKKLCEGSYSTYSQSKHWGRLDKRANLHTFNELLGNVMLLLICIYDYFPFMLICDWKPQTINSNPNALCNSSKQHILLVKCCRTPKTFNTAFINSKRNFMPTGEDDAWGLTRSVFDKWCLSKQQ